MTNEELAARVKAGDKEAAAQLWEQNRGLLSLMGWRLFSALYDRAQAAGVTWEDVQQIGFLACVSAAQGYNPQAGAKYATYLAYHYRREFAALVGLRTERQKREPLCHAGSLDAPIDAEDTDGSTRAEIVPDDDAAAQLAAVDDRIWTQQLHDALEDGLQTIDAGQAAVLRARYYEGRTLSAIATAAGEPLHAVYRAEQYGLRAMRRHGKRTLEQFRAESISRAYRYTGFCAWKAGGSSPERWAEWRSNHTPKTPQQKG